MCHRGFGIYGIRISSGHPSCQAVNPPLPRMVFTEDALPKTGNQGDHTKIPPTPKLAVTDMHGVEGILSNEEKSGGEEDEEGIGLRVQGLPFARRSQVLCVEERGASWAAGPSTPEFHISDLSGEESDSDDGLLPPEGQAPQPTFARKKKARLVSPKALLMNEESERDDAVATDPEETTDDRGAEEDWKAGTMPYLQKYSKKGEVFDGLACWYDTNPEGSGCDFGLVAGYTPKTYEKRQMEGALVFYNDWCIKNPEYDRSVVKDIVCCKCRLKMMAEEGKGGRRGGRRQVAVGN